MIVIILIAAISILLLSFFSLMGDKESRNQYANNIQRIEKESLIEEKELEPLYGKVTRSFKWLGCKFDKVECSILIFEDTECIIINNRKYTFSDIVFCELSNNKNVIISNSITKTSTGNMIGRAVIGGLLFGGVGAVIGSATATTKTTNTSLPLRTTEICYKLTITVNDISNPSITLIFKPFFGKPLQALLRTRSCGTPKEKVKFPLDSAIDRLVDEEINNIAASLSVIIEKNKK